MKVRPSTTVDNVSPEVASTIESVRPVRRERHRVGAPMKILVALEM